MELYIEELIPNFKNALLQIISGNSLNRVIRDASMRDLFDLSGDVLDIGGGYLPYYWTFFDQKQCNLISADMQVQRKQDIAVDLEKALPIPSGKYDAIICLSVLEHVYNYPQLLREIRRIKKSDAKAMFWIPFFIQPHGTQEYGDYFRFTEDALAKIIRDAEYTSCKIIGINNIFWVLGNMLTQPLYNRKFFRPLVIAINITLFVGGYILRSFQRGSKKFPIGYFVIAI